MLGITRNGSVEANGIAPSVIPNSPIAKDALPASRSVFVNLVFNVNDANPNANGGIQIATAIGPIME